MIAFREGSAAAVEVGGSFHNPSITMVTEDLMQLRMPMFRALLVGEQGWERSPMLWKKKRIVQ